MLTPYKFQEEIIDRFKGHPYWALLMEAGCGKTLIAIYLMRYWYNIHQQILDTIIFCPIITLENWKSEILQCSKIPEKNIGIVMGSKAKRLKIIEDKSKKILIINYEAMRTQEILQALLDRQPKVIIGDESHKFKNHKIRTGTTIGYRYNKKDYSISEGLRLKYQLGPEEFKKKVSEIKRDSISGAMIKLSQKAMYRGILSGTPIPKPEDIWSQFMFLDHGKLFGNRHRTFKNRYFANVNAGWTGKNAYPDWRFIPSMEPDYKERLASVSVSMKREECIDLPDLVEKTIHIEPSTEMRSHYNKLKNDLITWIEEQPDNPLVVQNALTKYLRLAEILSGYLRLEDESIASIKNNSTLDALMELLEMVLPAKIIIFSVFKQNYVDISNRLEKAGIKYIEIHGGIPTKRKLENVDIFNDMKNDVQVAIVNPSSGGVGINLKSASYSIYYSLNYSLIDFEQSRARNYRSGSIDLHKKITHYFLCHKGLITEDILFSVKNKVSIANNLLDLKKLLKEK